MDEAETDSGGNSSQEDMEDTEDMASGSSARASALRALQKHVYMPIRRRTRNQSLATRTICPDRVHETALGLYRNAFFDECFEYGVFRGITTALTAVAATTAPPATTACPLTPARDEFEPPSVQFKGHFYDGWPLPGAIGW